MKNQLFTTIALIAGLGLAGSAFARHDDFTGSNTHKANAAQAAVEQPSAVGGRHDEKPHGMTKNAASVKATTKPAAPTTAAVAPAEATKARL